MSYYDHAVIMALRLGPWANKSPTEIDRDIEYAAMMRQRLEPRRPGFATRAPVRLMLRVCAAILRTRNRKHGTQVKRAGLSRDGDAPRKT